MAKVQLMPQSLLCATPTVIVGTMVDGKPNFMTVAWVGIVNSEPPMVSVSIRPSRYTFKGIKQTMEFSVNIPSIDQLKETDYCGIMSGDKVDKTSVCGFKVIFGKLNNAPLIEQCPVNLTCKVEHSVMLGSHEIFIGKIEETFINDNCLTDGKPDVVKINPIIFGVSTPRAYYAIGKPQGNAFVNKELKKK